ncbi:f-box only protein 4 [Lynx pardinus]|uniref:F-box only protein 4 n=1 Tax=Lynx pardinus TaxID=191816 RepID=A0A485NXD1_LYNPA|nr:f-box only protein 4 [Lynx pardinus]
MAGSEPRSGGSTPPPHHSDWSRLEAAILSGWRNFWQSVGKERAAPRASQEEADEEASTLTRLPIDVQLYILSFLSPHDLCQLGSTSHYWNETVRDPILWRYFLLRDLPSWSSVDWKSLPDLEILKKPISEVTDGAFFDYMAVKERDRAREEHTSAVNKMFSLQNEGDDQQGSRYSVIPQIQKVCEVVDGFIYVANAEAHKRHEWQDEFSRIMAMTDPAFGSSGRPMLVLSCISQADVKRMPCFYLAHELRLSLLNHPWMVQDTEAETLTGFLNGIQWILEEVESKHAR